MSIQVILMSDVCQFKIVLPKDVKDWLKAQAQLGSNFIAKCEAP